MQRMTATGSGRSTHWHGLTLFIGAVMVIASACGTGSAGGNLDGQPIDPAVLAEYGKFEVVDAKLATVGGAKALDTARTQDFGRPGAPEVALVRSLDPASEVVALPAKELVWVFHWGGLADEEVKAFPSQDSASPQSTTFIRTDYILFVSAETGEVIAGVSR